MIKSSTPHLILLPAAQMQNDTAFGASFPLPRLPGSPPLLSSSLLFFPPSSTPLSFRCTFRSRLPHFTPSPPRPLLPSHPPPSPFPLVLSTFRPHFGVWNMSWTPSLLTPTSCVRLPPLAPLPHPPPPSFSCSPAFSSAQPCARMNSSRPAEAGCVALELGEGIRNTASSAGKLIRKSKNYQNSIQKPFCLLHIHHMVPEFKFLNSNPEDRLFFDYHAFIPTLNLPHTNPKPILHQPESPSPKEPGSPDMAKQSLLGS